MCSNQNWTVCTNELETHIILYQNYIFIKSIIKTLNKHYNRLKNTINFVLGKIGKEKHQYTKN